jgi:hypothetical protein
VNFRVDELKEVVGYVAGKEVQWGAVAILPPTPSPKKGIRCHHFGQHYDIYIYIYIYILYSVTLLHST